MNRIIKKIVLVSVSALLLSTSMFSQELPFAAGEKLVYNITYKCGFSADMVSMAFTLEENDSRFHSVCKVSTFKFWDSFYKMRETYETWFSQDPSLTPEKYTRDAINGKNYHCEANLDWNADNSINVHIERTKRPVIDTVYQENTMMRDMISSLYFLRSLDYEALKAGKKVKFMMTPYRDILELTFRYAGSEEKKIGDLGTCKVMKIALKITPKEAEKAESGAFKIGTTEDGQYEENTKEKIFLWVSDDANHVPLYFVSPASVGSITGRLVEHSGLKHKLDCIIAQ